MIIVFSATLSVAFLGSIFIYRKASGESFLDRYLKALLPLTLVNIAFLAYYKMRWGVFDEHNWMRLERTIAWVRNLPIYPDQTTEALVTNIYGPISAWVYLPAAWAHTPMVAVEIATLITMALIFMPPLWIFLSYANSNYKSFGGIVFACFAYFLLILSSFKYVAVTVHADASAHAFCVLACGTLLTKQKSPSKFNYILSGLFAVLAVWSKQVVVPVVIALPIWVAWTQGRKALSFYCLCLLSWTLLVSGLILSMFDVTALFFNMFKIPSLHPMKEDLMTTLVIAVIKLIRECLVMFAIGAFSVWSLVKLKDKAEPWSAWLWRNPWTLFLWLSLLMTPLSIWTNVKVGGGNNTFTFTNYYLWIGVLLALIQYVMSEKSYKLPNLMITKGAFAILVTVVFLTETPVAYYRIHKYPEKFNFGAAAYEYAVAHPGSAYFPRLTLVHLMAENKLYHSVDGLMDRKWANLGPSREHLLDHIPENADFIAFHKGGENHFALLNLEDQFKYMDKNPPELPGFVLYRRAKPVVS